MADNPERGLTELEYVVLGVLSFEPQSGYGIISYFEVTASVRWSASPGSIYPMLKRLESMGYIEGNLDRVYETRPRKVYELTSAGRDALLVWIQKEPDNQDVTEQRDTMMLKFLFAEKCLSYPEIMNWLDKYEAATERYEKMFRLQRDPGMVDWSLHQLLLVEMSLMEINMLRTWLQMARRRLEVEKLRSDVRHS